MRMFVPVEMDTKTFNNISTFSEFLRQWGKPLTPGEAVGLLYECGDVPPFGNLNDPTPAAKKAEEIGGWIEFYLRVGKNTNAKVANVAQQLLVKHWLRRLEPRKMMHPGYLSAAQKMLEFLAEPKQALFCAPYPRFVQGWLSSFHEEWERGTHPVYLEGDGPRNAMQHAEGFTRAIVYPICSWGLAGILAKDDNTQDTTKHIEAFLQSRAYNIGKALLEIPCSEKPPERLGFGSSKGDVNRIAALAYIRLELRRTGRISFNLLTETADSEN